MPRARDSARQDNARSPQDRPSGPAEQAENRTESQAPVSGWGTGKLPFRGDIEGLRGIALFAAFAAHAGVGWAAGGYIGVDIFFVISGFLITGLLLREIEKRGTISLLTFYAHRAKRLLPLAALVLAVSAALSALLLPPIRRELVAGDILAAVVYVVNWRFASQSVDYFAAGADGSPVLHFWSLAIEEQFYILWPALLLVATAAWRRRGRDVRPVALALIGTIGVASLVYSTIRSSELPSLAYYSTFTRVYEIAAGAALAVLALRPRSPAIITGLGIAGMAAIFWYIFSFEETVPYPGALGLIPTLATVAFIIAGSGARPSLANRFAALAPIRYIGRVSYSWYLWHWPAIVFAEASLGALSAAERMLVIGFAGIPAVATHHLVEQPLRYARPLKVRPARALAVGGASTAAALVAALALTATEPRLPSIPEAGVLGFGAIVNGDGEVKPGARPQPKAKAVRPSPLEARDDKPQVWHDRCEMGKEQTEIPRECAYGDRDARVTVVLTGDSLASAYFPAIERVAKRNGWRLLSLTKVGCAPFRTLIYNNQLGREYTECLSWQESLLERLEDERPNLVITIGSIEHRAIVDGDALDPFSPHNRALLADGYVEKLRELRELGARVVVLKDAPRAPHDVAECVSENLESLRDCAYEVSREHREQSFERSVARRVSGAEVVDMTPVLCPGGLCPAVIGDALVLRDRQHLTATVAKTLGKALEKRLPRPN